MSKLWRKGTGRLLDPIHEHEKYPKRLKEIEQEILKKRHSLIGLGRDEETDCVGFALSGGGIRSATLSLGLFQVLAQKRLLKFIDYISTVSGGGYFGGFFGGLFCRKSVGENHLEDVREDLVNENSGPNEFLRNNGRYLAPNGFGDLLLATAIALRNWLSVSLLIALTFLTAMIGLNLIGWGLFEITGFKFYTPIGESGIILFSPFWLLPLLILAVLSFPLGWAYWLVNDKQASTKQKFWSWVPPILVLASGIAGFSKVFLGLFNSNVNNFWLYSGLVLLSGLTILYRLFSGTGGTDVDISATRNRLSQWLTASLVATAVTLLITIVDTIGQSIFQYINTPETNAFEQFSKVMAMLYCGIVGVVAFSRKLTAKFTEKEDDKRFSVPLNVIFHLIAFILLAIGVILLSTVAHGITWWWAIITTDNSNGALLNLVIMFVCGVVLMVIIGKAWRFVNYSTMHPFYEARLRRAYLGASNPDRESVVSRSHHGDGIKMPEYHPEDRGGPLHLLNVTVNETVSGETGLQHQDRKGMNMAIGPAGISVARRHHSLWKDSLPEDADTNEDANLSDDNSDKFSVFPKSEKGFKSENLDLGHWIATSGAAVSTGLGSRTSLGMSLIAGFFNIRLGYWWDSGIEPKDRGLKRWKEQSRKKRIGAFFKKALPAQSSLLDEWFARFHGVARRHWYLTDGGHFENMGGYELIRRSHSLPYIIVCDNEQDVDFKFGGLANLVLKSRIDFNVEIKFLSKKELDEIIDPSIRKWFGTLEQLQEKGFSPKNMAQASLAGIHHRDRTSISVKPYSVLLYIKPKMLGDEPVDIIKYHTDNPEFPNQSTGDQFFDEVQWECYRRMGEQMGQRIFSKGSDEDKWSPMGALENPSIALELVQEGMKKVKTLVEQA